jgi:hypothetical protein
MMVSEHSDLIPGRPQRVLLLSGPRTASNLLIRLLSKQARFVQSDYYFFKSKTALNNDVDAHSNSEVPHDLRDRAHADLQKSFNKMQESIEKAEREVCLPGFLKYSHCCGMEANELAGEDTVYKRACCVDIKSIY